jgi:hypothetical protein
MKLTIIASALLLATAALSAEPYTLTAAASQMAELSATNYAKEKDATFVSCSDQCTRDDHHVACVIADKSGAKSEVQCSYKTPGCLTQ